MEKKKILYITGTRADYGLMQSTLKKINSCPALELHVIVTGMHLMPEFGYTAKEIMEDGFNTVLVPATYEKDTREAMSGFVGSFISNLTGILRKIKPDTILLLGDRGEMLAGAVVGTYLGIPVIHIHGGEISSTVDDTARHAITKLSHIHFPATEKSAERIIRMGENPKNVFVVGAPGLDSIVNETLIEPEEIIRKYNLSKPFTLTIQHPVSEEIEDAGNQIQQTLDAVIESQLPTVLVYPNADAGGREMIDAIKQYESNPLIRTYKSIPRKEFLSLMKASSVLIGNSSSGIIEAASFHTPVINIGTRQSGRERAENVLDSNYSKEDIKRNIRKCLYDADFKHVVKTCKNPYGEGKTGEKIVDLLCRMKLDGSLLQKTMIY